MPLTRKQRLIILLRLLTSSTVILVIFIRRQDEERRRHTRIQYQHEFFDEAYMSMIKEPTIRRWWVQLRSHHWIEKVLSEELLIGHNEFEQNFRMSRHSFEQLHTILRAIPPSSALMH